MNCHYSPSIECMELSQRLSAKMPNCDIIGEQTTAKRIGMGEAQANRSLMNLSKTCMTPLIANVL